MDSEYTNAILARHDDYITWVKSMKSKNRELVNKLHEKYELSNKALMNLKGR